MDADAKFLLKVLEGFGKLLVFLAAWLSLPTVLPLKWARTVALPVAFLAGLFGLGLITMVADGFLPTNWKFLNAAPPMFRSGEAPSDLLHPQTTAEYAQWRQANLVACLVLLPAAWGVSWGARRWMGSWYDVPPTPSRPGDMSAGRAVVVAILLGSGGLCDFVKWFLSPP